MSALSIQVPFPVFYDRDGEPLENGYVWIGQTNQPPQTNPMTVYFDKEMTQIAAQPLRTVAGYVSNAGTPAQVYVDAVNFSILVQEKDGTMVYNFPSGTGISPSASGVTFTGFNGQLGNVQDLGGSDGADWIGYKPAGTNSVSSSIQEKLREFVSVKDFGAVGDGVANDTAAIQAAIDAVGANGPAIYIPSGNYLITNSLNITNQRTIYGDGNRSSVIRLSTSSSGTYAINILLPNNTAAVGFDIGSIGIVCNAGSAQGSGISINTGALNSAVSQSIFHDMFITNCTRGIFVDGVVYMSKFQGITISGGAGVLEYGWYIPNTVQGQVIYNTFENLEVTNVKDNAYAYYSKGAACIYKNLTCDGCSYFSGFFSSIDGFTIEAISAAITPVIYALEFLFLASVQNVALINIPTSKCVYGIRAQGANFSLSNVTVDAQANRPDRILQLFLGNRGVISNVNVIGGAPTTKLEVYNSQALLNTFTFNGCENITDRNMTYEYGTWTPGYASWTTAPSTITARYTKIGRIVFVQLFANNGVVPANGNITGLPFTSSPLIGASVTLSSNIITGGYVANLANNSTNITRIPAINFTGALWQLAVTYTID